MVASYEAAIFLQVNEACWEEYAACRLSAPFGRGQLHHYEVGLRGVLNVCKERAAAARERFWMHRDLDRIVTELGPPLAEPLRLAAYVLGHIDGLWEAAEMSKETHEAIFDAGYRELIDTLAMALRSLWEVRSERTKLSDHDDIGDVARDAFWAGGMLIRGREDGGANIQVWEPGEVNPFHLGLRKNWRNANAV